MKTIASIIPFLALLIALSCNNTTDNKTSSTDNKDASTAKAPEPTMDSAAKMKAWQDFMTPGEMHKLLASLNGKWEGEITMRMHANEPGTKTMGYCNNRMIMGGRYQVSENTMSFGGMPFEGMSTMGFDNAKKVFTNSWIDNMGTGIINMEGPYDAATKTIMLKGKETDPMTGKEIGIREEINIIDSNNQLMYMYNTEDGKEFKSMEVKYTRK
jgi:hypothetical protein